MRESKCSVEKSLRYKIGRYITTVWGRHDYSFLVFSSRKGMGSIRGHFPRLNKKFDSNSIDNGSSPKCLMNDTRSLTRLSIDFRLTK